MWLRVILIFISSSYSIAALPELLFENVNGEYFLQKGHAHVMNAKYKIDNVELTHEDIGVTFNMKKKNLMLQGPNTEVLFGFDFSFLKIFKELNFSGVDVKLKDKEFLTSANKLHTKVGKYTYRLRNLKIDAQIQNMMDDNNMDQILDSFITKGAISVDRIAYRPVTLKQFTSDLLFDKVDVKQFSFASKIFKATLKWAKVKVVKGRISGSVLVDSWINAWLKFNGRIINIKKSNILKIELTKAKFGYFGVKRFVLKALKKLESDKISVNGNIIRILIN